MHIKLSRLWRTPDLPTIGFFKKDDGEIICKSAELPWRDNQKNISCIPDGTYPIRKVGHLRWAVDDVPNRTLIRVHPGNFINLKEIDSKEDDTDGCIMPGMKWGKMTQPNRSNFLAIKESTEGCKKLDEVLGEGTHSLTVETVDQEREPKRKGSWRSALNPKVNAIAYAPEKVKDSKLFDTGTLLGIALLAISAGAEVAGIPYLPEWGFKGGLALIGVTKGYKSKPQSGGKAGLLYRLVNSITTKAN